MKGYRKFIIAFALMLALYIVAEMNRPTPVDWSVTLSKEDKNPYGSFILYKELQHLFPNATINSYRLPVYEQVNNYIDSNTAYLLIDPAITFSKPDFSELLNYVTNGNYVFASAEQFDKTMMDTLKFTLARRLDMLNNDSTTINFVNPAIHAPKNYGFTRMTLDTYFNHFDTLHSVVLGNNHLKDANFIKINYGAGAFFIHAAPLSFSNYFMLKNNNAEYTAHALSYLPKGLNTIYWDEYYKLGPSGSQNPLRFILNNVYLRWSFRIALVAMLLFVFFEMKRRQRIIPVIKPLRNSTLDFVKTVGGVYYNKHDNKNVAQKKINYFLEYVRSSLFIATNLPDDEFCKLLSRKTGVAEEEVKRLMNTINIINVSDHVSDALLLEINSQIDSIYAKAK